MRGCAGHLGREGPDERAVALRRLEAGNHVDLPVVHLPVVHVHAAGEETLRGNVTLALGTAGE